MSLRCHYEHVGALTPISLLILDGLHLKAFSHVYMTFWDPGPTRAEPRDRVLHDNYSGQVGPWAHRQGSFSNARMGSSYDIAPPSVTSARMQLIMVENHELISHAFQVISCHAIKLVLHALIMSVITSLSFHVQYITLLHPAIIYRPRD